MEKQLPSKQIPIHSITVSWADVKRIYERLSVHVKEQEEREIAQLEKRDDQTDEDFDTFKENAKKHAFRITVTVGGKSGSSLYGDTVELFDSPNLPNTIFSVFMTNVTAYQGFAQVRPLNNFAFNLDFSKPPLLDGKNLVSSATLNFSNLGVEGENDAWVATISEAVMGVLDERKNTRSLIHQAFIYDVGLALFGLPAGFYLCWKLSSLIETYFGSINSVVSGAIYVYLILMATWAYRILFGYTKWAFPSVELKESDQSVLKHRNFWFLIVLGLVSRILWEVLA